MSRVRTHGAALAGRRSEMENPRGVELYKGLEENGAGPSGGGGGERGIFKRRSQGQARWAFTVQGLGIWR